jgi:hypothetical protein
MAPRPQPSRLSFPADAAIQQRLAQLHRHAHEHGLLHRHVDRRGRAEGTG